MVKVPHPMDEGRKEAMAVIKKIAARAVHLYADQNIRVEQVDILMDLSALHFGGQKLRLNDLLAADDANFAHDIGGINRHLDRETYQLNDGFSPRFSQREAA